MYSLLKVQVTAWSTSDSENKIYKTIQRPASPPHETNKYPSPLGKQSNMKNSPYL